MPDAWARHLAGNGERPAFRIVELSARRPTEVLATREQNFPVREHSRSGVVPNHRPGHAEDAGERIIELRRILSGKQNVAVGQQSSRRAKVAAGPPDIWARD